MLLISSNSKAFNVNSFILLILFVGLPVYLFSYFFSSNYVLADSPYYSSYWDFAKVANSFQDLFIAQHGYIGSSDAGYALFIGLTAHLPLGRYEFFSLLNSIVAVSVFYVFLRKWSLLPLYYSLMFFGYYVPVLFLTPERLRLAIFILIFSFLINSITIRTILLVLSVLIHAQVALLITGLYLYFYFKDIKLGFSSFFNLKINKQQIIYLIILSLSSVFLLLLNPHIIIKLVTYYNVTYNWKPIAIGLILMSSCLFGFISQALFCSLSFVFAATILFLGSYFDRSIIVLYFIYLVDYFAISIRIPRRVLFFWLLACITTFKSVLFYSSVLSGGGGFSY